MPKIKIKRTPQAKSIPQHSGNQTPPQSKTVHPFSNSYMGGNNPEIKINQTLQPTSREHATLEAEKGETIVTNLQGEGIPEFYKIAGKRHSQGGTPLNVPANSFIYSRDRKLAIKDPDVLKMFNKTVSKGNSGYTPADISMQYNLNKYREILVNPFTDKLQRETAEKMIQNYNLKLGQLALVQESMKGFDGDIPMIAQGYLQHAGIDPAEFVNPEAAPTQEQVQQFGRFGLQTFKAGGNTPSKKHKVKIKSIPKFIGGGSSRFNEFNPNIPGIADIGTKNSDDYMETSLKNQRDWGQIAQKMTGPALDFTAMIGRKMTEPSINYEDFTSADQVFTPNQRPEYGSNMFNTQGVIDPYRVKEAPQFTGTFSGISRFGGQPQYNYGGTPKTYFQNAGETGVVTNDKPIAKQDIPKEGIFWDPEAEGYDASKVKKDHYIIKNGRWYKVKGYVKPKYEGKTDERLGTFGADYELIKQKFQDEEVRNAFYNQYVEEMKKAKPNSKTGLTQADIDAALNMDKEKVINNFLKKQAINLAINAKYGDLSEYDKKDLWDKNKNLANETAKELGFEPLSQSEVASFQGAYIGLNNLSNNDAFKPMFKDIKVAQIGRADEQVAGTEEGSISQIDGWDGNTTSGEALLVRDNEMDLEELKALEEENATAEDSNLKRFIPQVDNTPTPYWTQDLNNLATGLTELYGIEKAKPWQAPLQYREMTPALQDFRGTAARIGSLAEAGARQAATFGNPNSFAANYSQIQSNAVDPILRAQEAERMGNQDIINKTEMFNTQNFNQFDTNKQQLDTQLYDKHIIANEQFKNAKTLARDKVRGLMNQALTNRGMTQSMNSMRSDFKVDPRTGFTYKTNYAPEIQPGSSQSDSMYQNFLKVLNDNPGIDAEAARKLAKDMAGIPEDPKGVYNQPTNYPGMGQ